MRVSRERSSFFIVRGAVFYSELGFFVWIEILGLIVKLKGNYNGIIRVSWRKILWSIFFILTEVDPPVGWTGNLLGQLHSTHRTSTCLGI